MLNKGDKRAANYASVVEGMIADFMEEVNYEELVKSGEPFCELPNHAVYREGSSTELRVVFDGRAKDPGCMSLNDSSITDIKKAFMQVGVPAEDRNYLLFRWHRKDDRGK
jgi:hypothetical protein